MVEKVLITGSQGQLMTDIIKEFSFFSDRYDMFAFGKDELDVTNKDLLTKIIEEIKPDVFIQGASYHVVEAIENNIEYATRVNIDSLHTAAKACGKIGFVLLIFLPTMFLVMLIIEKLRIVFLIVPMKVLVKNGFRILATFMVFLN